MRDRLATETAEERQARLQRMSANQHEKLASETVDEREARLEQMRANQHERLASETVDEREARLQQMSANQHERLASETVDEREARLQQMSANQHERLASETVDEREARLQHDRGTEDNSHNSLCLNSRQFELRCSNSMSTLLHWMHQHVAAVQRDFLVSSFAHNQLSVSVVAETNIYQSFTQSTTWILVLYHLNCRSVYADYMYMCNFPKVGLIAPSFKMMYLAMIGSCMQRMVFLRLLQTYRLLALLLHYWTKMSILR